MTYGFTLINFETGIAPVPYHFIWTQAGIDEALRYDYPQNSSVLIRIDAEPPEAGNNRRTNHQTEIKAQYVTHLAGNTAISDKLCGTNLPAGWSYIGQYMAMDWSAERVLSRQVFTCPHCALVEGRRILDARNQRNRRVGVIMTDHNGQISSDYMPQIAAEIIGEDPQVTTTFKDASNEFGITCGNCGRLGHNARGCDHHKKFHDKIGIEIEGRFMNLRTRQREADARGMGGSSDGSIRSSPDSEASPWEFKTKPGNLREALQQLVEFYPDESDGSCGMHVHMSFADDVLTQLQTKAFYTYFAARWQAWGEKMGLSPESEFFKRLQGDNDYCNPNVDELRDMTSCDRYSQLNFGAWRSHKTLECRLLPMFRRSSLGVAAVQELVDIYETYLADPEAHGFVWPDDQAIAVETVSADSLQLDMFYIDLSDLAFNAEQFHIELSELAPPAEGMVRIALPVNQPITVERLHSRLAERRAA